MKIREAQYSDLEGWVKLRHALWPHHDHAALTRGAKTILDSQQDICFLATDESSQVVGFIEGAIHKAPTGPYAHVGGWYVAPELRGQGNGKDLMSQFEQWCLHRAICLLTSDTTAAYPVSRQAHEGCGLREIHEFKIFMKKLQPSSGANAAPPRRSL
jgi:GNAT superfamily N-acetyltransferase